MKHGKAIFGVTAGSLVIALAAVTSSAGPTAKSSKEMHKLADQPSGRVSQGQQAQAPLIETTGFETPDFDAYTAGQSNYFCGINWWGTCVPGPEPTACGAPPTDPSCCTGNPNPLNSWFASASSQQCNEPHIDIVHPATGSQHMRFQRDPLGGNPPGSVGFTTNARVNAFTPDMGAQPAGHVIVDWDLSTDGLFGANFIYFSVGTDTTIRSGVGTNLYFYAGGYIYVLDLTAGSYVYSGPFIPDGNYHHMKIDKQTCLDKIDYYYNGALIHTTSPMGETTSVQRGILETDNGGGTVWDVDNYAVTRFGQCPAVCGDGTIQPGETCEPGVPGSGNCPAGRCIAVGQPGQCTCAPICTLAAPCPVNNGPNGPFLGPCQSGIGCIFTVTDAAPALEADFCGTVGVDTFIQIYDATNLAVVLSSNDDCENTDSFGAGSTPNASCFNNVDPNFESCTCATSASGQYLIREASPPGNGVPIRVNVNKKAACGQGILGSCCDTNGADFGCTDNVLQAACAGSWSNKKCADVTCVCIPNCAGRVCGSDGCGGSCGTCGDNNVCNGDETCNDQTGQCVAGTPLNCDDHITCNGTETCDPLTGCRAGTPLNCNDNNACTTDSCVEPNGCAHAAVSCDDGLACNGVESCNPSSGCTAGTAVNCDDGVDCTVDACVEPGGTCTHDNAACFTPIPTVSQWGIAVMALLLLIGAKIYFTRRQSTTA